MATIDDVERFWDKRPCNLRHSQQPVGTRAYFDEVEKKKFFVEPDILAFTNFDDWRGKRVLEIGCGMATAGVKFARHGAIYTGVELSQESLALAKQRFEVYGLEGTFYLANAEKLSEVVPVEEYDLIYSFGVIHHTPQPHRVVSELQRYMGSDTQLKIMLYAKHSWKAMMIAAGYDQPEAASGCPIAKCYSEEEARALLAPLNVLSVVQDHIFPYKVEPYKRGEYVKQPWFEAMPADMFRTLEKRLGWHLNITATR
jgi:SAM-dependent methyltransferase